MSDRGRRVRHVTRSRMKLVFQPSKKGVSQVLGELESRVMQEVWSTRGCTTREVLDRLRAKPGIAYTTVQTILCRLYKKGLLTRSRQGPAFVYNPVLSQQEFDKIVTTDVLKGLLKEDTRPVLSTFVELVSTNEQQLKELKNWSGGSRVIVKLERACLVNLHARRGVASFTFHSRCHSSPTCFSPPSRDSQLFS